MTGELDPAVVEALSDRALATGKAVFHDGVVLIPDTVMTEMQANGLVEVDGEVTTPYIQRDDGRTVFLFRWPTSA
jgi:hypothetical protein